MAILIQVLLDARAPQRLVIGLAAGEQAPVVVAETIGERQRDRLGSTPGWPARRRCACTWRGARAERNHSSDNREQRCSSKRGCTTHRCIILLLGTECCASDSSCTATLLILLLSCAGRPTRYGGAPVDTLGVHHPPASAAPMPRAQRAPAPRLPLAPRVAHDGSNRARDSSAPCRWRCPARAQLLRSGSQPRCSDRL